MSAKFDLQKLEKTGVTARGVRLSPKPVRSMKHAAAKTRKSRKRKPPKPGGAGGGGVASMASSCPRTMALRIAMLNPPIATLI